MVKTTIKFLYLVFCMFLLLNCSEQDFAHELYFGQDPPGLIPEKFAPGLISTDANELNCVFTPDGKQCFFTVWEDGINTIMTMEKVNGQWTKRTVASFSGTYSDVDPYITSDGKRLYFSSMRPLTGDGDQKDSDLWYVKKTNNGEWSDPIHLQNLNSLGKDDYYTSITENGTIYFSIFETHGSPGNIYTSELVDGVYKKSELVGNPISTEFNEHDPFISPDESYLIFTSNRTGGFGKGDLYISFKKSNGTWTEPKNMGEKINSSGYDFCPMLSHNGKYLFFTKNVNGNGDIYWVSSKIVLGY